MHSTYDTPLPGYLNEATLKSRTHSLHTKIYYNSECDGA